MTDEELRQRVFAGKSLFGSIVKDIRSFSCREEYLEWTGCLDDATAEFVVKMRKNNTMNMSSCFRISQSAKRWGMNQHDAEQMRTRTNEDEGKT